MEKLKKQRNQFKYDINLMEKDLIECTEQTEVKNVMSLVVKENGLKRMSEETKKTETVVHR